MSQAAKKALSDRKVLDAVARKHVGDDSTNLLFVTDDGGVIAIFCDRSYMKDAKRLADSFSSPCWVEGREGIEHDNTASAKRQREEED